MITIIGAGKFGQAISKLLGKQKHNIVDIEPDGTYSDETIARIRTSNKIIICVPSQALPDCLNMISGIIPKDAQILFCTKGLYEGIKTPTEIASEYFKNPVAALTGPNLSAEIMLGRPAFAGIAGQNAHEWAKLLSSENFKTIVEQNPASIEFGGAVKNIIALGAGLFDGYYGDNACNSMGSFVAFALRDIEHIYQHKHDNPLNHLSFIGDLFTTCMSESSRNHEYGHKFGTSLKQGKKLEKPKTTVEGYRTLEIIQKYSVEHKMKLPTINALYEVFYGKGKIEDIIQTWQ